MVLPCASVMVMVVLLNDEFTCAIPDAMFLRSRRRTRVASLPIPNLSYDLNAAVMPAATPKTSVANREGRIETTRHSLFALHLLLLLADDRPGRTLAPRRVG